MKNSIRIACTVILAMLAFETVWAQSVAKKIANRKFEQKGYAEAASLYEDIIKSHPDDQESLLKLAECYRATNNSAKALILYAKLANVENPEPGNVWYYASMLAESGDYESAKEWYAKYSDLVPEDMRGRKFARAYGSMNDFYKDSTTYAVRYLHGVNSWQADFSPFFYGKGLVFCSNRSEDVGVRKVSGYDKTPIVEWYIIPDTSALHNDIASGLQSAQYTVETKNAKNANFTKASSVEADVIATYGSTFMHDSVRYNIRPSAKVKKFVSPFKGMHIGPACYSDDLERLIFTANERGEKIKRLHLFSAKVKNHTLSDVQELPFNNANYSVGHPSFTPDSKRLYFASDIPGGMGGADIYYSDYTDGAWSDPVNVTEINTAGDELFPYVRGNGDLYFSSDGHPGLGGLDIFMANFSNDRITEFKNIGAPINSEKDDFGIIYLSSTHGYFSSNRKRGLTDDDLYHFKKQCFPIELTVYNGNDNRVLEDASVKINDIETHRTNFNGKLELCVDNGNNSFVVSKEGFEYQSITSNDTYVSVMLKPLVFNVTGQVLSDATRQSMADVQVKLIESNGNVLREEFTTAEDGKYNFSLEPERDYEIVATKKDCGINSIRISTRGVHKSTNYKEDLIMLCTGDVVQVNNIYYELNKAEITEQAAAELDKLANLMYKYPDMRIELRAHTDSRADSDFNLRLSAMRAQAVVDYLTGKGIVPYRMRASGYGESQLLNDCGDNEDCSEFEHQQNRRTEFKVLSINQGILDVDGNQNFHIGKSTN